MSNLNELKKELHQLRENTLSEFKEFDSTDFDSEKKEEWAKRNEKMAELVGQVKEATKIEAERKEMEAGLEAGKAVDPVAIQAEAVQAPEAPKSIGNQLMESDAYKSFMNNGQKNINSELKWNPQVELKTTLTETGYPPAVTRSDLVVPTATLDPLQIPDLIDTITTDQYQYKYLEETTFTNNSAPKAEGNALGENALAFTERTESIRKIGAFLPVTEELLADVSAVQGYLDSRLQTMVRLAVSDQIIGGSGSGVNLTGILNKSGINTFDFSSFSGNLKRIGQIYEAIIEIQKDSFLTPDAIVMNPADWYQVVTEVNAVTTSGSLNPLFVGAGNFGAGVQASLWGVPVIMSTEISAGTSLVGVFGGGQAIHIVARQGMEVAMSDSHDENFVKDIMVMKASVRLGLPIYRATAFCSITNI
jgi:HK97 family phage major capsid protein